MCFSGWLLLSIPSRALYIVSTTSFPTFVGEKKKTRGIYSLNRMIAFLFRIANYLLATSNSWCQHILAFACARTPCMCCISQNQFAFSNFSHSKSNKFIQPEENVWRVWCRCLSIDKTSGCSTLWRSLCWT